MEAVPRLPMISFQLKVSPEATAFGPKLKQYIRDFYNEDPESYSNEIHQLENLRATVVRPSIAVTGCSLLQKYYCQLHFLQSRFPMGSDEVAAVTFTWNDAYGSMVCSSANIRFEIMSILYNIGAVHTQLGARTERTSAEGMKMACAHFQCAAWAFEHLRSQSNITGLDLAPELMSFMQQLCLAQAQECILEKSMLDNRKPTIVAKVAKQIVDYYSQALATLEPSNSEDNPVSDTVGSKIYKNWKRYVKFKRAYHQAVTQLYQGLAAEEQQKMGERVAFYNASLVALNDARSMYTSAKSAMGITGITGEKEAIEEALTFTNDVIEGKRKAAKNENEFIYHEEVPEKDVLPTVVGASLVKGIPFSVNDPDVSGADIFARLVPMKVHEASSLYSEEKAKILRSVGAKIEERDQQLDAYLASLKLQHLSLWDPDAQSAETDFLPLPDELAERCAALNARPNAIEDLVDIMGKLSDTYRDVEAMLKEIDALLTEEEQREKRYQEAMGKRPPTIVATDLTREAKKYEEAHSKASESNQALHRAMTMHVNNLQVLAQPLAELMAKIPSPSANLSGQPIDNESEKSHARELKRILSKVDEMQRQRNELHGKLRDSIAQDDLTRLLVTATTETGSLEALFSEQISKHHATVSLIDQNLAAQDNILSALTDVYARTAETRKAVDEILKRRELTINSLITSYDAYEDLLAKSTKGLEFYRKLEVNVTKLLQRVKSTCHVQEEEREQIMARNDEGRRNSTEIQVAPVASNERKSGSGMKLRDHLAARLKNNISTNYQQQQQQQQQQQNNYGNEKHPNPIASVQPNSHVTAKIHPMDSTSANDNMGIPIHAVTPVAAEFQPSNQSPYQQYYPSDYTSYYMAQQQAQYHPGQYNQYGDESMSLANGSGGSAQSFPKTGTTNTESMYRQATRHSSGGTEVTSNSKRYAGYDNSRNEQISAAPLSSQRPTYTPTMSRASYENPNIEYSQYPSEYGSVPDNRGYSIQGTLAAQNSVVSSTGYHAVTSDQQLIYNQVNAMGNSAIMINQSPSRVQTPNQQNNVSTPNTYRMEDTRQDSTQNTLRQSQEQRQTYDSGQNYAYQALPQRSSISQQQQISQMPDTPLAYGQSNSTINQRNSQFSSQSTLADSSYSMTEQYPQNQRNSGITTSDASSSVNQDANSYSSIMSNVQTGQSGASTSLYYVDSSRAPEISQRYTANYASQNQQNYGETTMSANIQNSQVYGNYPIDTGIHRYPVASSISSQISGTASYTNGTEMIQSHTKSTSNQGYLTNYQYPLQAHNAGIIHYQNYSQSYGDNYVNVSQTNPGIAASSTDSYRGHPGYAYDPSVGTYSYSSGYQDSQNSTSSRTTNEAATYILPQDGQIPDQQIYIQQEANSRYTSASNGETTNLTTSSQYSNGSYQSPMSDNNYYTTAHENQSQNQDTPRNNEAVSNDQTYQQASSGNVKSMETPQPEVATKPAEVKTEAAKSNLDLLSELDITINHAPLVPEVHFVEKISKESTVSSVMLPDINEKRQESVESFHQFDEKHENLQIVWDTWYTDVQPKRDPLGDPIALQKFISDIEKYEKFVDSLTVKTLSGSTNLDIKLSEITDIEEREMKRQTCYVAQAHSSANRTTNLIPYDSTRVRLSASDVSSDYINASRVNDLTQWTPAAFIVAQAPKPESYEAFWTMIWEQGSEVVACLATDSQLNNEIYWPTSKDNNLTIGRFDLSLKNSTNHTSYVQRVVSIFHSERRIERVVVHMQYLAWPSTGLPSSPGSLLTFATDILSEQALRHCSPKPIIVHCLNGGSLSGLFLLAAAAVCHVRAGHGAVDVPLVFSTLVKYRRCMLDRDSLLFGYRMVLYHAQDTLMKRGILSSTRSTFECFESMKGNKGRATKKTQHCHPSDDFLHNLGVGIQHGIARQQGEQSIGQTSSQTKIATVPQEKTDKVDPLSQLDPLWSIRR